MDENFYEPGEVVILRGFIDWDLPEDKGDLPIGVPTEIEIAFLIGDNDVVEEKINIDLNA